MIQVKNLTKIYGTNKVLDNINLNFEPNKIYGVLGRNGAGKTTLVNIITNRAFATNGIVEIDGDAACENDKAQEKVFCITEKSLYPTMEKVSMLFKWAKNFYPNFDMEYANYLASRFDLETEKKMGKLSTGYTTIVKVILTLASNTPYMFFDEPVLGIDAIYREVFYEELKKKHAELKNCIILATHILDEAESVVDEIIILKKGIIAFNGQTPENLQKFYLELHKKNEQSMTQETTTQKNKLKSGKIDCRKVKLSLQFLFRLTWLHGAIILGLISLFPVLSFTGIDMKPSIDLILIINLFVMALTIHTYYFRYAIYNGVSRRTYFVSIITALVSYAFVFAFLGTLSIAIFHFNGIDPSIYQMIYGGAFNFGIILSMFAWTLFASIFAMVLSLFSMILYQTLARKGRYIVMIVLISIILGLTLWGTLAPFSASWVQGLLFVIGLKYNLGAWFAVLWFALLGAAFSVISWLILRRTEIK